MVYWNGMKTAWSNNYWNEENGICLSLMRRYHYVENWHKVLIHEWQRMVLIVWRVRYCLKQLWLSKCEQMWNKHEQGTRLYQLSSVAALLFYGIKPAVINWCIVIYGIKRVISCFIAITNTKPIVISFSITRLRRCLIVVSCCISRSCFTVQ